MQLSVFEMVKKGVSTIIEVVDAFAREQISELDAFTREQINQLNTNLNTKQNIIDNNLVTTSKEIVGAINELNNNLISKTFSVTAANQSINLTSFDCKRFGSMAKISMFGTTVRQLEANKAYFIPNLYINGMQDANLYGCGITQTSASFNDGADSYPCVVSISNHNVCFTPLVTIPSNFGISIELLCYLVP